MTLGEIVSLILAEGLARRGATRAAPPKLEWSSGAMGARVDLSDKDAVYRILDDGES